MDIKNMGDAWRQCGSELSGCCGWLAGRVAGWLACKPMADAMTLVPNNLVP